MKKFISQEIKEFVSKPLFDEKVILNKDLSLPKISIVTPSYDQAEFLERTILSVLNQNYPNLEYIIIDGGSTDGSVEIIRKYERYLAYWVSEKDNGPAAAINKGFKMTTGDIFAYLNSDDVYLPETLFSMINIFKSNTEHALVYGHVYMIDEDEHMLNPNVAVALPFNVDEYLYGIFSIPQQGSFWKRDLYEKLNGFNEKNRTCWDGEFFVKASINGFKFYRINDILACFRIHPKSISGSGRLASEYYLEEKRIRNEIKKEPNPVMFRMVNLFLRLKYLPYKLLTRARI